MKKFYAFLAAALMSVSVFAAKDVVPSDAVLQNYYEEGQLCVCIYVPAEMACSDVVFVGTYNKNANDDWITELNTLAKFDAVDGYDGWYVVAVPLGNPMRHDEKYNLINRGFAGLNRLTPYFNRQNNDDLLLAIQSAGVERGRNGFRKNKAGEKLAETEEDLLEHRTDGTDAFDTVYIGCESKPQYGGASYDAGGVM